MEPTKLAANRAKFGRTGAPEDALGCYNEPFDSEEKNFVFESDGQEIMERFALWLNSPWSSKHESYNIEYNIADAYSEPSEGWPQWRCSYSTIGYEYAQSTIYGFGDTEEDALKDCKKRFAEIQKKYNPEDDAV